MTATATRAALLVSTVILVSLAPPVEAAFLTPDTSGPTRSLHCQQSALWIVELSSTPRPRPETAATGPMVAVLDGAIDLSHPGIASRVVQAVDLVEGDLDPSLPTEILTDPARLRLPGNLHGTAMATLIADIAPDARLAVYRVLDENCGGDAADLAHAIELAVADGAGVLLISLEAEKRTPDVNKAIAFAVDHDVVIVAAAGNSERQRVSSPASDADVISVAAVRATGQAASFTAYGPHVTLADYGVQVATDVASGLRGLTSGTSVAAARTAGAVAVLRERAPWLDRAAITSLLTASATVVARDQRLGAGIVDLERALALLGDE